MGKNQRKPHKQGRNTHRSGKSGSSSPEVVVVVGDLTPPPPKGLVPSSLCPIDSFEEPLSIELARGNYHCAARGDAISAGLLDYNATLSPEDRAARGDKISASMKGNTNNTRPDTKHLPCPNPACAYRASFSQKKRDFTNHFAACSPCANFVRKTIDAKDPHGVLWGWKPGKPTLWPKWLPPKN